MPVQRSISQILADWFGIDLAEIEREKRRMLAAMREMSESPGRSA